MATSFNPRLFAFGIAVIISLLIIIDFALPGKVFFDEVVAVKKEYQSYYNASGSSHFSYKLVTKNHDFSVSENFGETVQKNQKIKYTISPLFNEVNTYSLFRSKTKNYYSLRIFSGLACPLLILTIMCVAYKFNKKWSILIGVSQIVLLANLVFVVL